MELTPELLYLHRGYGKPGITVEKQILIFHGTSAIKTVSEKLVNYLAFRHQPKKKESAMLCVVFATPLLSGLTKMPRIEQLLK